MFTASYLRRKLRSQDCCWQHRNKGACTHTGKTGAGSDSGAGRNVNKWVFTHAAGPAELPVRQISVPDFELDKPGARPAAGLSVSV